MNPNRPTAAPAHFPYRHRTIEQVDRDNTRSLERTLAPPASPSATPSTG